jgi:hypothetical protein
MSNQRLLPEINLPKIKLDDSRLLYLEQYWPSLSSYDLDKLLILRRVTAIARKLESQERKDQDNFPA